MLRCSKSAKFSCFSYLPQRSNYDFGITKKAAMGLAKNTAAR
jgi:hypothetical protein